MSHIDSNPLIGSFFMTDEGSKPGCERNLDAQVFGQTVELEVSESTSDDGVKASFTMDRLERRELAIWLLSTMGADDRATVLKALSN